MKTSSRWNFRSIVGRIMTGLALAAMIGSINVAPSFGDDDHDRWGRHDNGRYEQRGRGHDRDRYEQRGRGHGRYSYVHGRRVYQPYGYSERVYVPPPVYYEPPPPPGIRIFLPF
jgi:hypothetical protein